MVMTDRDDAPQEKMARGDAFRLNEIYSDMASDFADVGFWRDYNIIEPSESLERAVEKLCK